MFGEVPPVHAGGRRAVVDQVNVGVAASSFTGAGRQPVEGDAGAEVAQVGGEPGGGGPAAGVPIRRPV